MNKKFFFFISTGVFLLACNFGISSPTPSINLLETLAASTPLGVNTLPASPIPPQGTPTPAFVLETPIPPSPTAYLPAQTSSPIDPPTGKIVFNCQIFKTQASEQICIINADGTGFRRLTKDDGRRHYYPSISPDGRSVVYAAFTEPNVFDIFEMDIESGYTVQLTSKFGNLNAPEISPDGKWIVFKRWNPNLQMDVMYIMQRNGENIERFTKIGGWDPTWSPDGGWILFASNVDGPIQLYAAKTNGRGLHRVSNLPAIRGRSDWSPNGQYIVTYSGEAWHREVYIMNADGSGARVLSPPGGNAQGAAFSPDSKWIVFTAYYDHYGDDHGCELYLLRVDGTDLRRLTDNDYCDYQPRWGP